MVCGPEILQPRAWDQESDRLVARRFLEVWQKPNVKFILGARGVDSDALKVLPFLCLFAFGA